MLWYTDLYLTYLDDHIPFQLTQNDRIGFHYTVMCLTVWPILLWLSAREAASMRGHVERDIAVGLYSRTVFILFDVSIVIRNKRVNRVRDEGLRTATANSTFSVSSRVSVTCCIARDTRQQLINYHWPDLLKTLVKNYYIQMICIFFSNSWRYGHPC